MVQALEDVSIRTADSFQSKCKILTITCVLGSHWLLHVCADIDRVHMIKLCDWCQMAISCFERASLSESSYLNVCILAFHHARVATQGKDSNYLPGI